MADKPRVKAPKQRVATADETARRRRTWAIVAVAAAAVLGLFAVAAMLGVGGGGGLSPAELRTKFEAVGCTFQAPRALASSHAVAEPGGTSSSWNTNPPTSGPHYGIAAIFGIYEDELELARLVHNLEHGGVYILYGDEVPDATVEQLRAFYDNHKTGTIMAPLDRLGDEFALGAWVVDGDLDNAFLAKCKSFDEDAASSFLRSLQFRGPERFDPAALRPGH